MQFDAVENGISVTKLIQVFSKQAAMMDALISHFTEQIKRRKESNASVENTPQMPALDPESDGKDIDFVLRIKANLVDSVANFYADSWFSKTR